MTRPITRLELPQLALELRHVGELLATPCSCSAEPAHEIGDHLWRSTRDMDPTPLRAAAYDGDRGGWRYETDKATGDTWPVQAGDSTGEAAVRHLAPGVRHEYVRLLTSVRDANRDLHLFIDQHRPNRTLDDIRPDDPGEWCAHHLATIGTCEPRHRGDLCRACNDFRLLYRVPPPKDLLLLRQDGRRWTQQAIDDALRALRAAKKAKRKGKGRRAS